MIIIHMLLLGYEHLPELLRVWVLVLLLVLVSILSLHSIPDFVKLEVYVPKVL